MFEGLLGNIKQKANACWKKSLNKKLIIFCDAIPWSKKTG